MGEIMKKITKITGLLAALLILLCFVSCKQNAASTTEPNLVASFKGTMTSSGTETMGSTLSFYDDSSFKNTMDNGGFNGGTYTGDVSKDGTGKLLFTDANTDMDWTRKGDTLELTIMGISMGTYQKQ